MAALDLRAEPLVLDVPVVADRHYAMQIGDLFGTNPRFVGSRATGSDAGTYLLVGPGFAGDYLLRAAGAMAGWGGNDEMEAFYPLTREDADGETLSGEQAYRLRLDTPPPAKAFWSITMYDTPYDGVGGYLVDNPTGRYFINSTTTGLVHGDDGSLTIHIQRDEPDTDEGRANWLPSPERPLYLAMRIYRPEPEALDGTWEPPPVVRQQ